MPINRDLGSTKVSNFPADQTVTQSNLSAITDAQLFNKTLLTELLLEQRLTNLYLSIMVGQEYQITDLED